MIRRAAAVVLALALNPALVRAQDTVFTVSVPSADVYKGPSTVTPVVGHASRGTVLPVSRNLGSWIKVTWPEGPDGVGYVHVTMGKISPASATTPAMRAPSAAASSATSSSGTASSSPGAATAQTRTPATSAPPARTSASQSIATRRSVSVTPAEHNFGVGALIGSMSTYGATARSWPTSHFGVQLGFTRDEMTSTAGDSRMTSMQFEPGVMYAFFDHVSDYIWVRPYVGSTISFRHQTVKAASPAEEPLGSDNGMGYRIFGGTELMFASAPRFGVSADVGYRHLPTTFAGFDPEPLNFTIAGHWYFR